MRHYLSSVRISAEQTLELKHRQGWQKWLENRDRRKGCRLEQHLQKQDRFYDINIVLKTALGIWAI